VLNPQLLLNLYIPLMSGRCLSECRNHHSDRNYNRCTCCTSVLSGPSGIHFIDKTILQNECKGFIFGNCRYCENGRCTSRCTSSQSEDKQNVCYESEIISAADERQNRLFHPSDK
jgi:hypothetical protein